MELGRISLWNGETKERQAEEDLVNETIEHLVWSQPYGKRLITADKSGNVKAWRANGKAQLQQKPAWEFTLAGGCGAILCRRQEGASSELAKMAVAAMTNDMSDFLNQHNRSRIWAFTLAIKQMAKLVMSMRKVKKRLSSQWQIQVASGA